MKEDYGQLGGFDGGVRPFRLPFGGQSVSRAAAARRAPQPSYMILGGDDGRDFHARLPSDESAHMAKGVGGGRRGKEGIRTLVVPKSGNGMM